MKRYLRSLFKKGMFLKDSLLGFRTNRLNAIGGIILQYHSVGPKEDQANSHIADTLSIDPKTFDRQMSFVAQHYQVVTMEEIVQCLVKRGNEDKTRVAITFDDGYRDNYLYAYPILKKHHLSATFYLTVDCIKDGVPLWPAMLNYLVRNSQVPHLEVPKLGRVYPIRTGQQKLESIRDIKSLLLSMSRKQREKTLSEIELS
jgi:hypothetical protein